VIQFGPVASPVEFGLIAARIRRLSAREEKCSVHALSRMLRSGGYWLAGRRRNDIWADTDQSYGSITAVIFVWLLGAMPHCQAA